MGAKGRGSRIGVVGLGYVGLPLAVEFGKQYDTIGFDVNPKRVAQLRRGRDVTLEVTAAELKAAKRLSFTTELERLRRCQVRHEYGLQPVRALKRGRYDVAIVAVAHRQFRELGARGVRKLCKTKHVLYDVKHVFPAAAVDGRL